MKFKSKNLSELLKQEEILYIDIWILLKYSIKTNYKLILTIFSLMFLVSVLHFKITPVEYEATSTMLVEQQTNNYFSGISNLLGVNMPAQMQAQQQNGIFGPDMYQEIIESQAFLYDLTLQKIPYNYNGKDSTSLNIYFNTHKQKSIYLKLKNLLSLKIENVNNLESKKNKSKQNNLIVQNSIIPSTIIATKIPPIVEINPNDAQILELVKNRISLDFKGKKCIIKVKMPTPILSAIVSKLVVEKLTNYIILYKTTKQRDNINYLQNRFDESELKYKKSQQNLANFKDNSLGLIFQSVQSREQVLTNELTLSFNVYNQFAMQLEQAKVDLKKKHHCFR